MILLVRYILYNIISFIAYFSDKNKAKHGQYRVPEKILLFLSALGPFGGLIAMYAFHHKTKKKFFLYWHIIFIAIHIFLYIN